MARLLTAAKHPFFPIRFYATNARDHSITKGSATQRHVHSIRFDNALAVAAALLALDHATRSSLQLIADRCTVSFEFYRLFLSTFVIRTKKERVKEETSDKIHRRH
ncbi:hypothetical protein Y032_0140g2174 [Ancylostoma ceylanicum]|uniref:Uncharacterized protein n=1 Tax=Ancylostoma ceylanicum TaxID=53326 RepID=A0A016T3C1_9BILA|nr:hypothetical protein Y032_0140g2174 [Ancylostoma ceylanicum]